ncbi:MAG TPA: GNAT family N-acetyltransferase [Kribbella sp.]|uniref:GNAT family N-acetyltransferase n=1 Tax=Kribbella sp. TaxID=1871183 RepID=UPI002D777E37|nr:GNAT family N-acetyltransferase [Kribbella sp.]HET6298694.1 GNAT family N-acetyltransferase [Kribbella sp.]
MIATRFDTARLAMLPLRIEYAGEMAGVLAAPELYVFTGGEPPTAEQLLRRYERQLAGPDDASGFWLNWVIQSTEDDLLVGYLQATVIGEDAEIAWVLGTGWQGRGYAKEAALGLVDWLRVQGVQRVIAHVHPDHSASAAVAAAAGLTRTAHLDDGEYLWEL